jgi:hypothetical protein
VLLVVVLLLVVTVADIQNVYMVQARLGCKTPTHGFLVPRLGLVSRPCAVC